MTLHLTMAFLFPVFVYLFDCLFVWWIRVMSTLQCRCGCQNSGYQLCWQVLWLTEPSSCQLPCLFSTTHDIKNWQSGLKYNLTFLLCKRQCQRDAGHSRWENCCKRRLIEQLSKMCKKLLKFKLLKQAARFLKQTNKKESEQIPHLRSYIGYN